MAWLKILFYVLCTIIVIAAQYADDADYNDFDFYEDLSTDQSGSFGKKYSNAAQEDFYIAKAFDDTKIQREAYSTSKRNDFTAFGSNENSFKKRNSFDKQFDWYKMPEKIYRYTKHRIPGYDYDEFDYMRSRSLQHCDERSIWTHCLCQFTCSKPDVVDCYTPCRSGCECKEEYVFDEKTQSCLLPEHCSSQDNYNYQI